jgi:hypothetical protein
LSRLRLSEQSQDVLEAMRRRGDEVYAEYFGIPNRRTFADGYPVAAPPCFG